MSIKNFQTFSVHTCKGVKGSYGNQHNASIVLTSSSPLQYINNPRYFEGDATPRMVQEANSRDFKVYLAHDVVSKNFFDSKRRDIMLVRTVNKEPDEFSLLPIALLTYFQW